MVSKTLTVGPYGGSGGVQFDDGVFDGIRKIILFSGAWIDSITVVYDKHGVPVDASKHGGNGGNRHEINLEFPEEYIVTVSGHTGTVPSVTTPVVKSLKFVTNKNKVFGPYGTEDGTPFSLPIHGGKVVGFTGRSGAFIDAIAFRLSPN